MNRKWGVRTRVGHSETLGVGVWVNGKGMGKGYGLGVWVKGVRPIPPPPPPKVQREKSGESTKSINRVQFNSDNPV